MKAIYIAHSMTNGKQNLEPLHVLAKILERQGHPVCRPAPVVEPARLAREALQAIDGVDVVIADVSTYSHGVGFELGYAFAKGKELAVVCDVSAKEKVSRVISGLFPEIIYYHNAEELADGVGKVLSMHIR